MEWRAVVVAVAEIKTHCQQVFKLVLLLRVKFDETLTVAIVRDVSSDYHATSLSLCHVGLSGSNTRAAAAAVWT